MSTLTEAEAALSAAADDYRELLLKAQEAERNATDALNRLNKAQVEFDKATAELRSSAPPGSNWKRPPMVRA